MRTLCSFDFAEEQGLNAPLNKGSLSTPTKVQWVGWPCLFRTTYSIDGWGQIFQNLLQIYFRCYKIAAIFQFVSVIHNNGPAPQNVVLK